MLCSYLKPWTRNSLTQENVYSRRIMTCNMHVPTLQHACLHMQKHTHIGTHAKCCTSSFRALNSSTTLHYSSWSGLFNTIACIYVSLSSRINAPNCSCTHTTTTCHWALEEDIILISIAQVATVISPLIVVLSPSVQLDKLLYREYHNCVG